jgi:hypothetical protein
VIRNGLGLTTEQSRQYRFVAIQASIDATRVRYAMIKKGIEDDETGQGKRCLAG